MIEDPKPNSSPPTQEDLVKILNNLFADAQSRKAYVRAMTKTTPRDWKKGSTATYYKERYALELKTVIDAMLQDHNDVEYRYDEFPNLSKNSVYLRLNQAKMYLLDQLDYTGDYKRFFESVKINRERQAVTIRFIRQGDDAEDPFLPARVVAHTTVHKITEDIDKFLNDEKQIKFEVNYLCLSVDEQQQIEQSLVTLQGIVYNISSKSIKIVKTGEAGV